MTQEEKAKAYDEALERAKSFELPEYKNIMTSIFPELEESEDERIRRNIIAALKGEGYYDCDLTNECIAWLEKQDNPQDKGEISDGYHTFNELYYYRMLYNAAFFNMLPKEWVHKSKRHNDGEECFGGGWFIVMANLPTGQISNHYELKDWNLFQIPEKEIADKWDGHTPQEAADRLHKYLLEKQSEQKTAVTDFNAKDWYVSKVDGKIHDMTYNPADKVEPKFKVGDWLASNICNSSDLLHIIDVDNKNYEIETPQGNTGVPSIAYIDNNFHLWTIQDAKDGDVLAEDSCIFIIERMKPNGTAIVHCCLFDDGDFDSGSTLGFDVDSTYPATKEQRDLLFQKMKEAGYEWDDDKKELKKIDQKSAESPKDYHSIDPHFGISVEDLMSKSDINPKFNIGDVLCDKSCTTLDKNSQPNIEILDIRAGMYICNNCSFPIYQEDEYELVTKRIEPQSAWSEEDKRMCQETIDWFEKKCFPYALEEENPARESIKWLKSLKDRVQPKPKEWNDEDDYNLQCMIAKVTYDIQKGNVGRNNELIDWLKSLKERVQPQPKQEWSEEDEEMAEDLIKGCVSAEKAYHFLHTPKEVSDWLKSIKDRIKGKED